MVALERARIGDRIREARISAGLTQDRFAELLGTSRQIVIGWEKGRHKPSRRYRARIIRATGAAAELFDDEESG